MDTSQRNESFSNRYKKATGQSCFSLIGPKSKPMVQLSVTIPQQEDWVDHGKIIDSGVEGDWNLYLWGGLPTRL
jgi:hypothetical protein